MVSERYSNTRQHSSKRARFEFSKTLKQAAEIPNILVRCRAPGSRAPSLLARLLFGSEMNASGDLVGRIAGLVMLCLALGCWPRAFEGEDRQALAPLLALSLLATVYGMGGMNVGVLLWSAAAAHLILAILLAPG
jgi:hypothetical protein